MKAAAGDGHLHPPDLAYVVAGQDLGGSKRLSVPDKILRICSSNEQSSNDKYLRPLKSNTKTREVIFGLFFSGAAS